MKDTEELRLPGDYELSESPLPEDEIDFLPLLSEEDEKEIEQQKYPDQLPLLPLRNTVLFPGLLIPITVGRDRSIRLIRDAYNGDKIIGVVAQKDATIEDPDVNDLYQVGTVARIIRMLRMPDGNTTAIIQGRKRLRIKEILLKDPYLKASVEILADQAPKDDKEFNAMISTVKDLGEQIIRLSPNIPSEARVALKHIQSPNFLVHFISSNLNAAVKDKQSILEENDFKKKTEIVLRKMNEELQLLQIKTEIRSKVHTDIDKQQREFLLQQQLKKIQEELGGGGSDEDASRLREKAVKKNWKKPAREVFDRELSKLQRMNPAMPDYSVTLNYLELMLDLPWDEYTKDNFDLKRARKILDRDHFNLEKVKRRIIEYLAVLKLKNDMKSPILCFVGPPGVGKTSLGRSIAEALDRKFARMSLGGLRDEAEIRGHRKTYIGAMPGRILQSLRKVKSSNPVFMLDEVDKVGSDFRGDPSSALLEVLDPEQNNAFYDNYLEMEYDLSKVMFIATANTLSTIHPALVDRMEVIDISGYTVEDKVEIAGRHIVPRLRKDHGLSAGQIVIPPKTIEAVVEDYTRESGVRNMEKKLSALMRHVAQKVAVEEKYEKTISREHLRKILGPSRFEKDIYQDIKSPGVAVGLAWTPTGGDILFVEVSLSRGKGEIRLTGNLGDVMKESANTALSFIKAHSAELGVPYEVFKNWDIHIHVPEGAIPKDGPSAGVTMLSALTSALTQKKVKPYLAMTGEITLRGKVLPVGGIKEKILAAKRGGLKEVILPRTNRKDMEEIQKDHIRDLKVTYVDSMNEVIRLALEKKQVSRPVHFNGTPKAAEKAEAGK